MKDADILDVLTGIFRENFDDETIVLRPATAARDIAGWDSAKMVMLILAVEESFGVTFRSREIDALRSIGDWVALIRQRAAAR